MSEKEKTEKQGIGKVDAMDKADIDRVQGGAVELFLDLQGIKGESESTSTSRPSRRR
jgi:hypothetical protein